MRGDAAEGCAAERVLPDAFASAVHLWPSELRCAVADEFAPPLWRSLLIRRDEAFAVLTARKDEQAEGGTEAKPEASGEADDARNSRALQIMMIIQEEEIAARGKPLKVRALGRELKKRSGLPARFADILSARLPDTHKNSPRR